MNKSLIPLFFILFFTSNLLAQDLEPTDTLHYPAPAQTHFMLGWHWGASRALSSSLKTNQYDAGDQEGKNPGDPNATNGILNGWSNSNKIMITAKSPFWTHCFGGNGAIESYALQYEPTLLITDQNKIYPDTNNYDNMNPIFGFRTINKMHKYDDPANHQSWLLINDTIYSRGDTILDNPWVNNQLYGFVSNDPVIQNDYSGDRWFISLNIRRSNSSTYMGDDPLIEISMPYGIGLSEPTDTTLIRFDTIPSNIYGDYDSLAFCNRGAAQNLSPVPDPVYKPTKFYIRAKMLPINDSSITISARFTVNGDEINNNPHIRNYNNDSIGITINKMNIRVVYLNADSCPLQINWIRIETPHSRKYFYGVCDQDLLTGYKNTWNHYNESEFKDSNDILFRFNNFIEGGIQYWAAERYLNKLIGRLSCGETGPILPRHYEYFIKPASRWLGLYSMVHGAVPFLKLNNLVGSFDTTELFRLGATFGFQLGNRGKCFDPIHLGDSLPPTERWNSYYETYLYSAKAPDYKPKSVSSFNKSINYYNPNDFKNPSFHDENYDSDYNNYFNPKNLGDNDDGDISIQAGYEQNQFLRYYFDGNQYDIGKSGFQYSEIPWWSQIFPCTNINKNFVRLGSDSSGLISRARFLTGEEMRLFSFSPIIMGCKGIMICGGDDNYMKYGLHDDYHMGLSSTRDFSDSSIAGWNWLNNNNDNGRSDFIMWGTDSQGNLREPAGITDWISPTVKPDMVRKFGTTIDRIYIGRRSMRIELEKIYDWINTPGVSETLMKLRLQAWYGKGYAAWYNQHPDYGDYNITHDAIMKKFIDFEHISTKRCFAPDSTLTRGTLNVPEDWSQSMYDVSLLKNTDFTGMDTVFYIGIQNRRTDPLMFDSTHTGDLYFVPSAEQYDNAINPSGGDIHNGTLTYHHTQSWWQQNYFRQLGSREFTIPFIMNDTNYYKYQYPLLKITELGGDDSLLNTKSWRQPLLYCKVDTIIGMDGKLTLKLLPGEGRLLKITVLRSNNIYGNLAHSNQSKLISNPILTSTGTETDSMRFHLVYFKPLTNKGSHILDNGVYYSRSLPIKKNSLNSNIVWEKEICVSDTLYDPLSEPRNPATYDSLSCDYPSIVVRTSGDTLKAYIVYSCKSHSPGNMIVETILDVNDSHVIDRNGRTICLYSGLDRSEWGNPVVSAVSNGNVYAWSDSTYGIIAGWKSPSSASFTFNLTNRDTNHIAWKDTIPLRNRMYAKHPSLNVYSHYSSSYMEDNCTLVWQEPLLYGPTYDESNIQIFYTRLKDSLNHFKHYIPPYATIPVLDAPKRNPANNIALMSDTLNSSQYGSNLNKFPVVHRNLDNYGSISRPGTAPNRNDRIYWESYGYRFPYYYSYIAQRPIDLYDSLNISLAWNVYAKSRIISGSMVLLTQPVITQGYSKSNYNQYSKGLLLDFLYVDQRYYGAGIWKKLYQLPHSLSSFVVWSPLDVNLDGEEVEQYGLNTLWNHTFFQNHLSHHNKVWDSTLAWQNRRVFNVDDTIPYSIQTSARYFYKTNADENKVEGIVGFSSVMSNYLIHTPTLDGQTIGLHLPFIEVTDSLGNTQMVRSQNDTIFSDWFNVNDLSTFDFKCKGYDSSKVQIAIQRESDWQIYPLIIPNVTTDTLGKLCKYFLVNGNDNQYRLLLLNRNASSSYSEEVWIGGLPVDTMLFVNKAVVNMGYDIIDLGGGVNNDISNNNMIISVHPNPANEVVYINGLLPASVYLDNGNTSVNHRIKYQIYSQIGCVQMTAEGSPGETVTINTSGLSAGVYFIRAENSSDIFYNPVSPVMGSFVISR